MSTGDNSSANNFSIRGDRSLLAFVISIFLAVEMLLKSLSRFFWVLRTFDENSAMALLAKCFPDTLYKLRKHLGLLNEDDFVKYVVCPKFKSLYDYKDCIQSHCGRQVSAHCKLVAWSRHPHRRKRGKVSLSEVHQIKYMQRCIASCTMYM